MPPHIVLVHCHDLGKYVGCYGAGVETPRIDALAGAGLRFDRHFVTAPQCSPSRSSLMTGRHPHQNGMLGLAHGNWEVGPHERFLPELLGEAGYETHRFGLQHVTEFPERLGYDRTHNEESLTSETPTSVHEGARARTVGDDVAEWLEASDHDDPFFASVGFFELHRVAEDGGFGFEGERYDAPDPDAVEPLEFLPDRPGIRSDIAGMNGMVRAIDDGVGTIVEPSRTRASPRTPSSSSRPNTGWRCPARRVPASTPDSRRRSCCAGPAPSSLAESSTTS